MTSRVIALDLDGTLLTPQKTLLPSSLQALKRAQEVGFRIGLGLVLMLMVFATYNDILHFATS